MKVWIALLRGVNVGGHKKLPMAEFRTVLGDLGFQDVATYIQSGNAVFRADGTQAEIANQIETAIIDSFGFECTVMVISRDELSKSIAKNPYSQTVDAPTTLHLFFLADDVTDFDPAAMQKAATKGEEFHLMGKVFYFHTPNGMGRSDLAGKLGRFIKTPMTGRNLRSSMKIAELADNL